MVALISIEPEMGRIELGNIWYIPSAHRTYTNTEVRLAIFLSMLRIIASVFDAGNLPVAVLCFRGIALSPC